MTGMSTFGKISVGILMMDKTPITTINNDITTNV